MQLKISTLEGMAKSLSPYRQKGNSTKLIDNAIQIILSGHICVVEDHWEMGKNQKANQNLFDRIINRFENEHGMIQLDKKRKESTIQMKFPLDGRNILDGPNNAL